jgi:hypothetical protein
MRAVNNSTEGAKARARAVVGRTAQSGGGPRGGGATSANRPFVSGALTIEVNCRFELKNNNYICYAYTRDFGKFNLMMVVWILGLILIFNIAQLPSTSHFKSG